MEERIYLKNEEINDCNNTSFLLDKSIELTEKEDETKIENQTLNLFDYESSKYELLKSSIEKINIDTLKNLEINLEKSDKNNIDSLIIILSEIKEYLKKSRENISILLNNYHLLKNHYNNNKITIKTKFKDIDFKKILFFCNDIVKLGSAIDNINVNDVKNASNNEEKDNEDENSKKINSIKILVPKLSSSCFKLNSSINNFKFFKDFKLERKSFLERMFYNENLNQMESLETKENDDNQSGTNQENFGSLFTNSILFALAFKYLHATNVYLVQPNLNLYLDSLGYDGFHSGYMISFMNVAKIIACFVFSYWTTFSYKYPYICCTILTLLSNIVYVFASNSNYAYQLILISRFMIGFGSAKLVHKRLTIEYSTFYNLFFYAAMLMVMENLGRASGPLLDMILSSFLIENNSTESFIYPSLIFSIVWILVLIYILMFFKDPIDIKNDYESIHSISINALYRNQKIDVKEQLVSGNQEINVSLSVADSFELHLIVLLFIVILFKGLVEFILWLIPIFMSDVFSLNKDSYSWYTIITMLSCKNI